MQVNFLLLVFALVLGALGAVLLLAMVRLGVATRRASRNLGEHGDDSALVTGAFGEAVTKIRERERVTYARAAASERLSDQIIASLSSGLLVVGVTGEVRILNPVGRRLLGLPTPSAPRPVHLPMSWTSVSRAENRSSAGLLRSIPNPSREA